MRKNLDSVQAIKKEIHNLMDEKASYINHINDSKTLRVCPKEIREEFGLTQSEMASLLDLTQNTYSRKERGDRHFSFREMKTISNIFGLSLDHMKETVKDE